MRAYLILHNASEATLITETLQCTIETLPTEISYFKEIIAAAQLKHASAWVFGEQILMRAKMSPARAPREHEIPRHRPARLILGAVCYGTLTESALEAEIGRLERLADYGRNITLGIFTSALARAKSAALALKLKSNPHG